MTAQFFRIIFLAVIAAGLFNSCSLNNSAKIPPSQPSYYMVATVTKLDSARIARQLGDNAPTARFDAATGLLTLEGKMPGGVSILLKVRTAATGLPNVPESAYLLDSIGTAEIVYGPQSSITSPQLYLDETPGIQITLNRREINGKYIISGKFAGMVGPAVADPANIPHLISGGYFKIAY